MKRDRNDVLSYYLKSEVLREMTKLDDDELTKVNFSDDSSDEVIETIKKMIMSYCNDDTPFIVLKNINNAIKKQSA